MYCCCEVILVAEFTYTVAEISLKASVCLNVYARGGREMTPYHIILKAKGLSQVFDSQKPLLVVATAENVPLQPKFRSMYGRIQIRIA